MQYLTYSLGINKKVARIIHRIILTVMLYNSFLASSQTLLYDYFTSKHFKSYFKGNPGNGSNYTDSPDTFTIKDKTAEPWRKTVSDTVYARLNNKKISTLKIHTIDADIVHGVIGIDGKRPLDFAGDNIFKLGIAEVPAADSYRAYITYETYGLDSGMTVPFSINESFSSGGYIFKKSEKWVAHKEEIDVCLLKKGTNNLTFSIPEGADYSYEVRNVKLTIEPAMAHIAVSRLVVNTPSIALVKDNQVYLKGFTRGINKNVSVYAEGIMLNVASNGLFEGFLTLSDEIKSRGFIVVKATDKLGFIGQDIVYLDNLSPADQAYQLPTYPVRRAEIYSTGMIGSLAVEGAVLSVSNMLCANETEVALSALRPVDTAPLNSGMTNVSQNKRAWRVEFDDIMLSKVAKLEISYDPMLLPHGYSANDIKVFYFDKKSKTWRQVQNKGTVNNERKTISIAITEGGDYINGIIQSPESPQTQGFTPTILNGIQAADPATDMTIISPPEVSQKGTANVTYPIKIPSGRRGMQPELQLQYNSEAKNGWIGQGWNIDIPALTLDTRWGVPIFDAQNESEMYMLNGEQLMYPNLNNSNWMPNRHYDIDGSTSTVYNTQARARITNAVFTERKAGSFSKIERMGSNPTNYYWKVTDTQGMVFWYGGKDAVVDNAVIKNGGNIVYWGLYMVEDPHLNNIKYVYENYALSTQSGSNANLSGARIFNVKYIYYTGFQGSTGNYIITFNVNTGFIRNDATIDGKLGIKIADPYFLDNILVGKADPQSVIRKYSFKIGYGKFNKGQLKSVTELDRNDKEFYTHTFDYYDDLAIDGNDVYFSATVTDTICNDVPIPPCTDSDGDGICDSQDQCPDTPGTAANYGCPEFCSQTSFAVPGGNIYKYYDSLYSSSTTGPNTQCFLSSFRLAGYQINTNNHSAISENIFVIHGQGNNPNVMLCPSGPITYTPNNAIENQEYFNKWTTFWSNVCNNENIQAYNQLFDHTGYTELVDFPSNSTTKAVNRSRIRLEFYAPQYMDVSKTTNFGVGPSGSNNGPISWWDDYVLDFSRTQVSLYFYTDIYINNSATSLGVFYLNNSTYVNQLQTLLQANYPGTTVTLTSASGSNPPIITINTTNPTLQSIKIIPQNSNVANVYTFNPCVTGKPALAGNQKWDMNKISRQAIERGIKEWLASGEELKLPYEYKSVNYIVEDDGVILKGMYEITESENLHSWKYNGKEVNDKKLLLALDDFYGIKEGQQSQYFKVFIETELLKRKDTQANAIVWLQENPLPVAKETVSLPMTTTGTQTGNSFYTDYFHGLLNSFTINFSPVTSGNPDCAPFINANFVIPGQIPSFLSAGAILGSTASTNFNLGGHLGFGVDFGWDYTSKNITVGGAYNHSWDDSESLTSLIDITGDGLDDIVFKHYGALYYKKHTVTRTYDENNNPLITHAFASAAAIHSQNNDVSDFFKSFGESSSTNIQVNFGFSGGSAFAGYETSKNKSINNIYFTDANSDGLIDIVNRGIVYFNRIDSSGNPYFEPQSLNTENMLIVAEPVTVTPPSIEIASESPSYDVVKVWEAPADGTIKIENTIVNNDPAKEAIVTIETGKQESEQGCGSTISPSGQSGSYTYTIDVGSGTGITCINYDAYDIPDKFDITWNGTTVTSGYRGLSTYNNSLINAGISPGLINTGNPSTGEGQLCFNKTSASPSTIQVTVSGPLGGTGWNFSVVCPGEGAMMRKNQAIGNQEEERSFKLTIPFNEIKQGTGAVFVNGYCLNIQNTKYDFTSEIDIKRFESDFKALYKDSTIKITDNNVSIVTKTYILLRTLDITFDNGVVKSFTFNQEGEVQNIASSNTQRFSNTTCSYEPGDVCLLYGYKLDAAHPSVTNTITTATTTCNPDGGNLRVKKGDRIYFRVHSTANGNPPVSWNPKVSYTSASLATITDQNGIELYSSNYSDGFILSDNTPMVFPGTGTVKFEWSPVTVSNPTDQVVFEIIKKVPTGNSNYSQTVFFTQTCPANTSTTVSAPGGNTDNVTVNGTLYMFRVRSTSNVNWKSIEWKPKMITTVSQPVTPTQNGVSEGDVTVSQAKYPIPDYSIYTPYLCGGTYKTINVNNVLQNNDVAIGAQIMMFNSFFEPTDNGTIYVVAKRGNSFAGKVEFNIVNGIPTMPIAVLSFGSNTNNNVELTLYTDDSSRSLNNPQDVSLMERLANAPMFGVFFGSQANTQKPILPEHVNLYNKKPSLYGPMYRQWGQFMYNAGVVTGATAVSSLGVNLLKEELLTITNAQATALQNALLDGNNGPNSDLTSLQNINLNDPGSAAQMEAALENISNNAGINSYPFLRANPRRDYVEGIYVDKWISLHPENYSNAMGARAAVLSQAYSFDFPESITQGALNTGAYGIDKRSVGDGKSISAGGGFGGFGASGTSALGGNSNLLTDYVDLNGDGYPDIITRDQIQYTKKAGGLFSPASRGAYSGNMSDETNGSWGFTASGTFSKAGKKTPGSEGMAPKADGTLRIGKPGVSSFGGGNNATSISGNFGQGETNTSKMWADINGDGLPDIIIKNSSNVSVYLNLGNVNFTPGNLWGNFTIGKGKSTTFGGGIGYNYANASIEAGVSLGRTDSDIEYSLIDVNADGLLDYVSSDNNHISIDFNRGNKFGNSPVTVGSFSLANSNSTTNAGLNGTFTYSMIWPLYLIFVVIPLKIPDVSVTVAGGTATNRVKKSITDFDGDGYPDLVEEINSSIVKVSYSRIRRTDLLKTVHNPLGGAYTVDYEVQPVSYDNPHAKWTMKSLIIEDGYDKVNDGEDIYKKEFTYEKGRYDRREREFYGYETVKTSEYIPVDQGDPIIYRTLVSRYYNRSYYLNGLLQEEYIMKGNDEDSKFSRTINKYEIKRLNGDNTGIDLGSSLSETFDVGGKNGRHTAAVLLKGTTTEFYELNSSPQLVSQTNMVYDEKARIVEYHYLGNPNNNQDDYTTQIKYHTLPNNIITIPAQMIVKVGGQEKRKRATTVNSIGELQKVHAYYDNSSYVETNMKYDQYGNLIYIEYPENENQQKLWYTYTYDSSYYKYVTGIEDAYGYTSTATYNSDFDKLTKSIDLAGNEMRYSYDSFGRNTIVLGPKEIIAGKKYTIMFRYYTQFSQLPSGTSVTAETFVPVALTKHYDVQHDDNDIEILKFVDGLGRLIQVKKDIYLNKDSNHQSEDYFEAMSISGKTYYDEFGRPVKQFHPYYETKSTAQMFLVNEYESQLAPTTVDFEELDRRIQVTDPAGSISTTTYAIAQDEDGNMAQKIRIAQQQNGSTNNVMERYTDVNGNLISVMNEGPSGAIWTRLSYNAINELLSYTDAEGLQTIYEYDKLGRKILIKNTDSGTTTYKYDQNDNIVQIQTPNLAANNSYIQYSYEYKHLVGITFPQNPDGSDNLSNVKFEYGGPGSGNNTGKVIFQQDASGTQEQEYGNMGEIIECRRIVIAPSPSMPNRLFTTRYTYDSWNRLMGMIYPDGEKVAYSYDLGGNLNKIEGNLNGNPYEYIKRLDYDYYEKRQYVKYANETENFYSFTPDLLRLDNFKVKTADGQDLLNNTYKYDNVGNILNVENSAGVSQNYMGGHYSQSFKYDKLNRLTDAGGEFTGSEVQHEFNNDFNSKFELHLKYNNTHGIVNKGQFHDKNNSNVAANTYENSYSYYDGTHRVEKIVDGITGNTEVYKYDQNGNIINKYDGQGASRNLLWDESNRLRVIDDNNNSLQHYIYDASGQRILKANSDVQQTYNNGTLIDPSVVTFNNYKMYPNAFIVIDEHGVYSKHYYAGSQRIVSRIGDEHPDFFDVPSGTGKMVHNTIKELQQKDLLLILSKTKYKKVIYNEYKPYTYKDVSYAINEENALLRQTPTNTTAAPPANEGAVYFYHSDQIGTTTFLTDINGYAYQFFINLPFGETMAEQLPSSYYITPYKFNGKELDEETGLYYYGARYYDPRASIWMSVDPLLGNDPNVNPYVYCVQNPVTMSDPDGRSSNPPGYYMNSRGFWMEGDSSFGEYVGNVKPDTDRYMELVRIKGTLYHKNTDVWAVRLWNKVWGTNYVPKKEYSVEEETWNDVIRFGAEWAITGVAFKVVGGLAGQLLKSAGNSLWKIASINRGFVYESMLNLKGTFKSPNFPVIDAFYNGVATSIKTLDLAAKSYLKGNAVYNTLKGYIDKLAKFEGASWVNEIVKGTDIKSRVLEIGIPRGATAEQIAQINKAVEYAAGKGIKVNVRVVK